MVSFRQKVTTVYKVIKRVYLLFVTEYRLQKNKSEPRHTKQSPKSCCAHFSLYPSQLTKYATDAMVISREPLLPTSEDLKDTSIISVAPYYSYEK
jgi:hypothetical protein